MIIKMYWERCPEFVLEEQDGYFVEATAEEANESIVPALSPHEKLKYDQMKEIYVAKATSGIAHEGCFYFLVSRDAQVIKFESVAFMTSDLSARGGAVKMMPDIRIERIFDVSAIDPSTY